MKIEEVIHLSSIPTSSPSYPRGPYRFLDREYLIISYRSDPEAIRRALPDPLEPDGSETVLYEFISMPDSAGFGSYSESGIVIPCLYQKESINFIAQMYLDCQPPIAAGREIWGFPKKSGDAKLVVVGDTLTGTLSYAGQQVALGTMAFKHQDLLETEGVTPVVNKLSKTQVNLKIIPSATGEPAIAQLVGYNLCDIRVKGAWSGPARLHLIPHVNAPVADLPVKEVLGGLHFLCDLVLPYGRVLHDYLKD